MLDYSILYLKSDIAHLSDVFQKFSNFSYKTYNIDPRHSFTLPGFSWQCMLKMTKIELELISDPDMYLFLMDTIRGGISVCNKKHVIADNKYIDKNSKNNKYLLYLDANNLYGHSMSQNLPYRNFKWSNELTLGKKGIYEVDIEIPKNLHDKFANYPLCPEIKNIQENMLSDYQKYLNEKLNIRYSEKDKKLILYLSPKKNYPIYYKNLEYYMKLGVKVTKIHRILTFDDEKSFLKEYINLNTNLRKKAQNNLEKDLFKLMNNAIFGKSMENVLDRSNIKLINNDPEKLLKMIRQPNFENAYEISNKLCLVESKPIKTVFNKPIYMGAVILETSKLHMYQFWYDHLKNKYDKIELIYTDTDSFIISVETDDIYNDMLEDKHLYDFSDYPIDHPNYDITNKKIIGRFKDELNGKIITEFIGLKPKMYSFNYIDNDIKINKDKIIIEKKEYKYEYDEYNNIVIDNKVLKYDGNINVNTNVHKGIKNSICLKHDEYKRSLYKEELIYKEFYNLQLNKQNIYLDKINKIALNCFDSKRFWINNIASLPFGYEE